ncbi:UbiA-like protein EboC [Danxiaibacter flavus]|uniref:UbiA-like protein EboC n=1 Tax=Danxiaibacter flavus TaxID=3049108 RepID=A0ABV3ZKH0_9BACT|nr:UbiA-like protein EboC [Chitinophagaceae bacterium DXS]
MKKVVGMLRLMRLANIITAIADILAGVAIAGFTVNGNWNIQQLQPVLLLVISTTGLYGGGVVFNDVFDAALDKVERPERPIPSGLISKGAATSLGAILLLIGIVAASLVHPGNLFSVSTILAIVTAICALVYDKWGKHQSLFGPVNMGLCRGANLLLGMSIIPEAITDHWYLGFIPVVYIAAITMISRGEVHGGKRTTLYAAVSLYLIVIASIIAVAFTNGAGWQVVPFVLLFGIMIFPPLRKAIRQPAGPLIGKAVKAGVIALIIMNAAWAAAFGMIYLALLILVLLPVSIGLAKLFAVT